MHVVQLAVGDVDEAGNTAAQIEQRVHLHRSLGGSEMCPGEERQAQIDGRRVQGIDRIRQRQPQVFVGVELARLRNQSLRKIGVDAPVARLVGVGQCGAVHRRAEAHMVELVGLRRQTRLDVAQTFPVCQLCKGHMAFSRSTTNLTGQ